MALQQRNQLVFETDTGVVFLLSGDIAPHLRAPGLAHAERRIAGLPGEGSIATAHFGAKGTVTRVNPWSMGGRVRRVTVPVRLP